MAEIDLHINSGITPDTLKDNFGIQVIEECSLGVALLDEVSSLLTHYGRSNNPALAGLPRRQALLHSLAVHSSKGDAYINLRADYDNIDTIIRRRTDEYARKVEDLQDRPADLNAYERRFAEAIKPWRERASTINNQIKDLQIGIVQESFERYGIGITNFPGVDTKIWATMMADLAGDYPRPGMSFPEAPCLKADK